MERNGCLNNLNDTTDSDVPIDIKIPLPILIRQMLDKAFGKPKRTIKVTEDQCTFENKNYTTDSSLISPKDENLHNETKDCSSLHESVSNCMKHKNNKLITIEEENTNCLHCSDNVEFTGMYLNRLLKSTDKSVDQIDHDDSLAPRSDTKTCANQIDTNISINDSLCCTDFTNFYESSISQKNDKNESTITINSTNSFNVTNVSSDDENTADFLNILEKWNSPKIEQVSHELSSSLEKDKTYSSIDASLVDVNFSSEGTSKFTNSLISKKRRSKQSLKTRKKFFKTPRLNTSIVKTQYRTSLYMTVEDTLKTPKTTKISKVHSNRAKSFKSFDIHKQERIDKPRVMVTPATPDEDQKYCLS